MRKSTLAFIGSLAMIAGGCTMSYQNICTSGEAEDLIDENQTATPQVTAEASVPVSGASTK